ncbi:UDP-N-acetylmuramoyl-tripeptide--D-alanyl-D-alanine ligase [Salisaeta longa]|uniref:UDP-N-acetylmuramoyl-tripeptide--D-alanyl-D- alanine ligase n=1 Tax=Salisaeta longa TaxID=503170 RepID=UPI0003B42F71|nr:UDP-N-acetylmuramoyl-tripeptide--D-alanyl-D-alanine ligase [Salisaeta longa]
MAVLVGLAAACAVGFAGWRIWRRTRFFLHIFQLETYKPDRYGRWLKTHVRDAVIRRSHGAGAVVLGAGLGLLEGGALGGAAALLVAWAGVFISSKRYRSDQEKKPLAFTARMTRLAVTAVLLAVLLVGGGAFLAATADTVRGVCWLLGGLYLADVGAPVWVALAAFLMQPVETAIHNGFKRQARQRLAARPDLTVIGITGSYGKTSTKFIVAELLRQKYNVLATPSSYNTPMGVCLVVNEKLKPEHQVLVLEMGIRYPGDIKELCDIATPDLAVVTTVGVAHLETMGSIENIAQEKGSILEHAAPGAPAVLNVDNAHVAAMEARARGPIWRASVDDNPKADLTAHDIRYDTTGCTFTARDDTGTEVTIRSKLLGRHNIQNLLLGLAVGRAMGLRLRQMAHAVRRIEPVEHRLQLRQNGDITIIDDAFNSNPIGARNAVEILSQMGDGRRIMVTPGMVELGDRAWEENKALGVHIAEHAIDRVVLIGEEQTAALQAGLRAAHFPSEQVAVYDSLFEAQEALQAYLQPGDVVLYENDLPDQYST